MKTTIRRILPLVFLLLFCPVSHADDFNDIFRSIFDDHHQQNQGQNRNIFVSQPRGRFCAYEGQFCGFRGEAYVYYGYGNRWVKRLYRDGVECSNRQFGDPARGVNKACYVERVRSDRPDPYPGQQGRPPYGGRDHQELVSRPRGRLCAQQREHCNFRGEADVYYGAGNSWVKRRFRDGVACNNRVFGNPARGARKSCYFKRIRQNEYPPSSSQQQSVTQPRGVFCAKGGDYCRFRGEAKVYFGADNRWFVRRFRDGVKCSADIFGDPLRGARKSCYVEQLHSSAQQLFVKQPRGVLCAKGGDYCRFRGEAKVYFGADNHWVVRRFKDGVKCSANIFGDPLRGARKSCYVELIRTTPQQRLVNKPRGVFCAKGGDRCRFRGEANVYFGVGNRWFVRRFRDGVKCSADIFGDPAPGARKSCFVKKLNLHSR